MNVLVVDDEWMALELLTGAIMKYNADIEVHAYRKPSKALEYAKDHKCEVAFLDLSMFEMNGLELAKRLQELQPDISIIFTTGFSEYAVDAFQIHASGYLLKPITPEKVKKEMDHLLRNTEKKEKKKAAVDIRCFGNFEVFIEGQVMNFKYAKTKELLAYLVDRKGTSCTNREIMAILWEDGNHDSYLRNIKKDLLDSLKEKGYSKIINSNHGKLNIEKDQVNCDYYNWLRDHSSTSYFGEYMAQYSWAEVTNAWIEQQSML